MSAHGFELGPSVVRPLSQHVLLRPIDWLLRAINQLIVVVASLAIVGAALILTYSVAARYFFNWPTEWQDEASVFLIVGAVFLSAAHVQDLRGHVAIEALSEVLPPFVERCRQWLVDVLGLAFCTFFAWKSWTLMWDAIVEDTHSNSTWGPPLSIPYGIMAGGMTLLSVQLLLQVLRGALERKPVPSPTPAAELSKVRS